VLEHVNAPHRYLQRAVDLLRPAGLIICSIPNVGHWSCVLDLIEGRWDYAPAGIHCATHVRFFTPHSIQSMFRDLGLEVIEWVEVKAPAPDTLDLSMLQRNFNVNQTSLDTYAIHAAVRPRK
jgi:O-antigen biosynthesis protein